jgi:hypothetical protein
MKKSLFFGVLCFVDSIVFFLISTFVDEIGSLSQHFGGFLLVCLGVFAILWLLPYRSGFKILTGILGVVLPLAFLPFLG